MGCGSYLFFMTWGMGIICTIGAFIVQPRSQAPMFLLIGIAFLIAAGLWTYHIVKAPQREAEEKRKKKLEEQTQKEAAEKQLAHMEGLEKYHKMDAVDAHNYQEGIKAMRELGVIVQNSVYQEKEHDWAVLAGIAEGIGGPVAGITTAVNVMQDNARISTENAARREWGIKQNIFMQDLARQAEQKRPTALSMAELQQKYEVILSWAPSTLFSLISLNDTKVEVDSLTGAVTVSTAWSQKDKSICIDGSLRAKIYTDDGKCAGCAYLVFPKVGTVGFKGNLSGICSRPKPSAHYTVKIEPLDLWELASGEDSASRKSDNLTAEAHRKIVYDEEAKFMSEIA